jgi:iron-sulfur cluster repair protein YtfE (RIC family)
MRDYDECRPFIDHLLAEHRRLHKLIHQARTSIVQSGGPDGDESCEGVAEILCNLRRELQQHFTEEEEGGCLDEAVSRCPRLSHDAQRLENEHVDLLAEVDRLIVEASDCGSHVENRVALQRDFDELCRQLHAHEAAENDLLRQGFGANVNGDENDQPTLILDT